MLSISSLFQGDSGGPVVVKGGDGKWGVAGIVSYGRQCALKNSADVYARVSTYLTFIISNC